MNTTVFEVAPEEDLLYSLSADGKRRFIYPVVYKGRFWITRRNIAVALFLLYFALPLFTVGGYPAVFLDIASRRFHVFGTTFHPTDNLLLAAFGFGIVVTVFFVGSTFGRMWCGFACPQTVYLEFLFRPIEALFEGRPAERKRLDAAPLSARKALLKTAKWTVWTVVAVLMATTFVAYFTSWDELLRGVLVQPSLWKGAIFTAVFLTALILFDFGWFRDQMCTIACPYGRLQNVMADADTILVAYDENRGEPRARLRQGVQLPTAGDCIECGRCVAACPTGVDIRRGLQAECIGTAQCVDACDDVMRKIGKPTGLIRFTSEREQQGDLRKVWRPRTVIYLVLMTVSWGAFWTMVLTRGDALVEIVRGGREAYRLLPGGQVANQQRIRFTNQLEHTQRFTVSVVDPQGATLVVSDSPVVVDPEEVVTVNAVTTVPRRVFDDGEATVRYLVTSDQGFRKDLKFVLIGPFGDEEHHEEGHR